jgi:hypothetical protein
MKLIEGNLLPTSGSVEKPAEKTYLTFQPFIPKDCYGLTVEEYLAQQVPEGAAAGSAVLRQVSADCAVLCCAVLCCAVLCCDG